MRKILWRVKNYLLRDRGVRIRLSESDSAVENLHGKKSDKRGTSKRKKVSETDFEDGSKGKVNADGSRGKSKRRKLSEISFEDGGEGKKDKDKERGRGDGKKRSESESAVGKKGKSKCDKRDRKELQETDLEDGDKGKKAKEKESKTDSKSGKKKGVGISEDDADTGRSKSKSGKGMHGKGSGSKGRGRDKGAGTDQTGMKGKMGRGSAKSVDRMKKYKSKHDTDDLIGGDLKNTSSRKSRSPTKIKSLKGTCGIRYQLSDPKFIDIGWTILPKYPNEKKLILYYAELAKANKNWFTEGESVREKLYSDGTVFTMCNPDGSGNIFYPNGSCAISVKRCEEGTYIIAYNPSQSTEMGTVAAIFDSIGNGVVYSPAGKIRLSYTQQKGIFYDTSFKVPIKWNWLITGKIKDIVEIEEKKEKKKEQFTEGIVKKIEKVFAIKERLASLSTKSSVAKSLISGQTSRQQFDTEKPSAKKSSTRRKSTVVPVPSWNTNGSKISSEAELIKQEIEKNTSLLLSETSPMNIVSTEFSSEDDITAHATGHKFSPIKSIVLKINKHISLRILDQENINLQISCGKQTMRLELGVVVNPEEILDELFMDAVELNSYPVICYFELFRPASLEKTLKLLENQRTIAADEAIKKFIINNF